MDDNIGHETRNENESIEVPVNSENQLAGHSGRGTGSDRTVSFVTLNLYSTQAIACTVNTGIKTDSEVEMGICAVIRLSER